MAGKSEMVKVSMDQMIEDTIYVAVGKDVEESKCTLSWALQYFSQKKLGILHVHQPDQMMPLVAGSFPVIKLGEHERSAIRELERQIMHKILDDYLLFCQQAGVHAEKLYIEMNDIGEGIVELICQHNIKKLVMGAAANKHYSGTMTDLKSKKAIYVRQLVPFCCQIWFTCKGHLIHTGDGDLAGLASLSLQSSSTIETGQSSKSRSPSLDSSYLIQFERTESDDDDCELGVRGLAWSEEEDEEDHHLSAFREMAGAVVAENSRGDVYEPVRHGQAGETAVETNCKARALERLYTEELRHRKEIEDKLTKETENFTKMKKQWDEERLSIIDQKLLLEVQVASLNQRMKELQSKLLSAEGVLEVHRKEQDDLQVERDNALNITEELLKKQAEDTSSLSMDMFFYKFSFLEIEQATSSFDPSLKIWEGRHGSIYKGSIHHTPVAIKVLNSDNLQGPAEFQQEVDTLSKLRHPNLVALIGVCPEACALVFEYLANGNLEDRLSCKDSTPPLSWQTRVHIAAELCSVLIFLHSRSPHIILHGDLKAANILLDANFICKLGEFRNCRSLSLGENSSATFSYLDPYFLETEELSSKSDIYSFGVILLQLLTGGSDVLDIRQEMEAILDGGNLNDLLDPLAGAWPYVQANQLAHLALRCCDMNPNNRPDLVSEVWRVLEAMRSSCGSSSSFQLGPEERSHPPSYFMCPIYQEVMQNPHVAADGYTYEEEALKGWLDSGHDTSPMTNLKLDHSNLVPNHALRSAIQEWLQLH